MTDEVQPQLISCRVCGSTDKLRRCSKCKGAFYCSQTHQQSDWRSHKIECRRLSNNNSSLILLETQSNSAQLEQNRSKNIVWTDDGSHSVSNTDDADAAKHGDLDSNTASLSNKIPATASTAEAAMATIRPQHLSKFEQTAEDERENQRQFRNLAENSMKISNENILSPNMVPR